MYCNNPFNSCQTNARQQFPGTAHQGMMNQVPTQEIPMQQMPMMQMPMMQMPMMQQIPMMQTPMMQVPLTGAAPVDFDMLPQTPVMDIEFTQGYLRTQIGRRVKVEFLIGTSMLVDREGILTDVGISYIIINETETDDLLLCDIYSIKFVKFYY